MNITSVLNKKYIPYDFIIDVVYMSGKSGGFENILNIACSYLCKHGFRVRFIQMVSSGMDWSAPEITFHCLNLSRDPFSYDGARAAYAAFLREEKDIPALILAAGWPNMVYICKGATADINAAIPVCAWLHGDLDYYREGDCGTVEVLEYADMCFAISRKIAEDILHRFPDKVVYMVKNTALLSAVCYSDKRNTLKLACVGRLSHEKAIPMILYALERTKDPWELFLVGDGPEEDVCRNLVAELGLVHRVHFSGWTDRPWDRLSDCRAMVMASLYEGAPLVVLEALACGMQVIATPAGNLPELITEGSNGYLWSFGKPEQLTAILDRLATQYVTPETALVCKTSVREYLPENTLFDFLCKVYACVRCKALPQQYGTGNKDLYFDEHAFNSREQETRFLEYICSQEYYDEKHNMA